MTDDADVNANISTDVNADVDVSVDISCFAKKLCRIILDDIISLKDLLPSESKNC